MTNDSTMQATTEAFTFDQRLNKARKDVTHSLALAIEFGFIITLATILFLMFSFSRNGGHAVPGALLDGIGVLMIGVLIGAVYGIVRTVDAALRYKELLAEK